MKKEILLSGLLGGIVIFAWLIISAEILQVSGNRAKPIPNDKEIHTLLKERIIEPGIYFLPDHPDENRNDYPDYENEPIFSIIYGGRTPRTFLGQLIFELFCIFAAPVIAAWMLSVTSERILAKYSRRVLFVAVLGLFLAAAVNSLITWALVGLVIAWRIKPKISLKK
jgi:hypothetical protein